MNVKIFVSIAILSILSAASACRSTPVKVNAPANAAVDNVPATALAPAIEPTPGGIESQAVTPEILVKDLYAQHDAYQSPFAQMINRPRVDKYFTKALADLIWKDETTAKGNVGAIEKDPIYDAEETEIKDLNVGKASIKGDTATVVAEFENFEQEHKVTFDLKKEDGLWKIDDIKYPKGDSLKILLEKAYPGGADPVSTSGFQGKYKVADMTCTVKPILLTFEVTWDKGKDVEKFVAKENNTFESSSDPAKVDKFIFADEKCDAGMFYRADGATFAVKRTN